MSNCILCNGIKLLYVTTVRDDANLKVYECNDCGHIQINPPPAIEEDTEYYENNIVYRQLIKEDELDDIQLMTKMEQWTLPQVLTLESVVSLSDRILEIGSGYGWLVEKMRNKGYCFDGVELNWKQREMAKSRAGVNLLSINLNIDALPTEMKGSYDWVCMFHVLEHMKDPVSFLKSAISALKPNGKIMIEVPNFNDYAKKISDNYDKFSYKRQHISYFKEDTLKKAMIYAGIKPVEIKCIQRYSVENALYWCRNNKPFLEYYQTAVPESLEFVDKYYREKLENSMEADSLVSIGTIE